MHEHHTHSHASATDAINSKFVIGICLNLGFLLAEIIAGLIYNSMALLTDAGHNASDVASLLLSLIAFRLARKKSTSQFTYGFKKTTVLAALANAVVLLIAIGILGFESVSRLLKPQPVEGVVIAWVAAAGIVINSMSAFLFYSHKEKDWLDPAVGLVIMVVILISTWSLLRDSFRMTIDAVPSGLELEKVKKIILHVKHVQQVGHVHVWPLSTTENALTAHVAVDEKLNFEEKLRVVENIKHELLHHDIHHSTIELEKTVR
jgi:cobalt-zinc-cadmium efflux system protein